VADEDFGKAIKLLNQLAKNGNAKAQNELGIFYEEGKGVTKNLATAMGWYMKAAVQDFTDAESKWAGSTRMGWECLGMMTKHLVGLKKPQITGHHWLNINLVFYIYSEYIKMNLRGRVD